jgi:hypothetical protein
MRQLVYEKAREQAREFNERLTPAAFDLLDAMLPTEVIQLPVVADAELVCAAPAPEMVS